MQQMKHFLRHSRKTATTASKGTLLKTFTCDTSTHFSNQHVACMCLLAQSISLLLFLRWLPTSTVLIQEVIKGYKFLFIHIPELLGRPQGEIEPVQPIFKCHPRKIDVGSQIHVCLNNLPSISVTSVRGVCKVKWENWEFIEETATHVLGKGQDTLWVSLQKVMHRCVYSPCLPKWTQLWNKEDNFVLCQFLFSS